MNPEVSVIIPAYNTEAYIGEAIQSALGQTTNNIEVIVVDDASTDQTLAIAESFTDPRLKVIANQQNIGAGATRNRALIEAKGKWIALLDSDDWYALERLEKLLQIAYAENADIVADDFYYIKDGDKIPWSTLLHESGEQINQIRQIDSMYFVETDLPGQRSLALGLSKPLLKRDFLEQNSIKYDEHIRLGQDFWFYLKCLASGARFIFIPIPYYYYRSRPGSLVTSNQVERLEQYCSASLYFLEQDIIKKNPQLFEALSRRLVLLEKTRPYFRVVDSIRRGHIFNILSEMVHNPYFVLHLIRQSPRIILRRLKYFLVNFSHS